jgi:glycosyltransferase involved in cell wall biosynthesis
LIALDCRYVRNRITGLLSYVTALVELLPVLAPDLEFLFLAHPDAERRLAVTPNAREVVFPYVPCGPATLWGMSRLLDLRGVRVFHAPFNILPVGLPMPTVTTIHDVMWLERPEWVRPRGAWARLVEQPFMQYGMRRALAHSTRIAVDSQATFDAVARLAPDAAARTRVTWLGVGLRFRPASSERDAEAATEARKRWVPGAGRYVLTVGQYAPYKNHEAVVRAFATAFARELDVHLALVQRRGEWREHLGALVRRLGVESRVHFLRDVPYDELVALHWGALLLCHPSLCEGFGNPPAEAMAAGCPVITSDRPPMREIGGEAAVLVDPERVDAIAAAMRRVAKDAALRATMRTRGLAQAAQFPWRRTAETTLAIYRELLDERRV